MIKRINPFVTAFFMGINSGVSYALLVSSLGAYLNDAKVSLGLIGLASLLRIPYSFKFAWAPIIDTVKLKFFPNNFGQRKSWIILNQGLSIMCIAIMGFMAEIDRLDIVCIIACFVSFFSASYDIAMEAYRIELFDAKTVSYGSSATIIGFRGGWILSGALALFLSSILPWHVVFWLISSFMIPSFIIIFLSTDTKIIDDKNQRKSFKEWIKTDFIAGFAYFYNMPYILLIFLIIGFFKASDSYIQVMSIPFLLDIGFSKAQIAIVEKAIGIWAAVAGTLIGARMLTKLHIYKTMLIFGTTSCISNLLFVLLAKFPNQIFFGFVSFTENFFSGISNIILIQFMTSLCNKEYTATQYAILISVSGFTRMLISSTSGFVAQEFGWINFMYVSSLLTVPALLFVLILLKKQYNLVKINNRNIY